MKYVIVCWRDAYRADGETTVADAPEFLEVHSVGWLAAETADSVKITTDIIIEGEDRDLHVIPKPYIQWMITQDINLWQAPTKRVRKTKK